MTGLDGVLERAQARLDTVLNGKWRLTSVLGMGGMATVYAAVHRNKKKAAIKMLHPELSMSSSIRQRFLREGYVANSIEHPGVVRIDDDDVAEDGAAYLVMELLNGETLDERADRLGGTLPAAEVFVLIDQLLDVLAAAHAAGVVHRDLKPENLFLTTRGELKVLDFGIARLREAPATGRTSVGSFMGTPAFMSPEQARGRWDEVDARSDIWAVGATMYTLVSGSQVFPADTVNEQLILAATTDAPSLALLRGDLPEDVIALVDRALARDRAARWQDVESLRVALHTAVPLENIEPPRAPSLGAIAVSAKPIKVPSPSGERVSSSDPTLLSARADTAPSRGTAIPVTQSMPAERGKRRPLVIGAAAAVFAALSVVILLSTRDHRAAGTPNARSNDGRATIETAMPTAEAVPAATQSAAIGPASSTPATPKASADPQAASSSAPGRTPVRPTRVHSSAPKAATSAESSQRATPSSPPTDPFDRRF